MFSLRRHLTKNRPGLPQKSSENLCKRKGQGTQRPQRVLLRGGEGTQRAQLRKGRGPKDPGVAAPLAVAGCRGDCWRVVDRRPGKIFHAPALFVYGRYLQYSVTRGNHLR